MTHSIDAILFDMGGTLRRTTKRDDGWKKRKVREILTLIGSDASPAEFGQLLSERSRAYRHWAEETLTELNEVELWTRWMLPDWPMDRIERIAIHLNQIWRDANSAYSILPEAKEVILTLSRRGYRLGLVSNTSSSVEAPHTLDELGISGYFDTVVLSSTYGRRKPSPSMLLAATERMGIDPARCAYVGDRPERDVAASRKAGFAKAIIMQEPPAPFIQPDDPALAPDHIISNLKDLLMIFPSRGKKAIRKPTEESPVYDAAMSTMWMNVRFPSLNDSFIDARRLGYSKIELNHRITSAMLAGIDLDHHRFSSVHEPCPADISVTTLKSQDWLISAQDGENRRQGVQAIKRSIALAAELDADIVVVHAGNVQADLTGEDKLRAFYDAGQGQSKEYEALKEEWEKVRAERVGPRLEAVIKSLRELVEYAGRLGIRLGLENRYHYMDIPIPDEMEILLGLAGADQLGFVYDVGHAQALDRLGFFPHEEWLKRYAPRIIETHLHDVVGIHDHNPPGLGEIDFDQVAAYLPKGAVRTLEIQPHSTTGQIESGLQFLVEHGCINRLTGNTVGQTLQYL